MKVLLRPWHLSGVNMYIGMSFIGGIMLGIEVLWGEGAVVIDLGIIRLVIGIFNGEQENE